MTATIIMKTNTRRPMKVVTTMIVNTSHQLKVATVITHTSHPRKIVTMIVNTSHPMTVVTMTVNMSRLLKIAVTMIVTSIFEHSVIGVTQTDANATTHRP